MSNIDNMEIRWIKSNRRAIYLSRQNMKKNHSDNFLERAKNWSKSATGLWFIDWQFVTV